MKVDGVLYCDNNKIVHQIFYFHISHRSGIAENNRHILVVACILMIHIYVSKYLWFDVVFMYFT